MSINAAGKKIGLKRSTAKLLIKKYKESPRKERMDEPIRPQFSHPIPSSIPGLTPHYLLFHYRSRLACYWGNPQLMNFCWCGKWHFPFYPGE